MPVFISIFVPELKINNFRRHKMKRFFAHIIKSNECSKWEAMADDFGSVRGISISKNS